jgi:hypothetical protein
MNKRMHTEIVVLILTITLAFVASISVTRADPSWTIQTVDAKAELLGISVALDSYDMPHFVYCATPSGNSFSHPTPEYLMYASRNGSGWSPQILDNGAFPGYTALAFDSNDSPHIVYSSANQSAINLTSNPYLLNLVNYLMWNGTSWIKMVIDGGIGSSIALDSEGNPHIAYASGEKGLLKYASWAGTYWVAETVDPDFWRPLKYNGAPTASQYLTMDANNNPCIVYSDESTIKIARGSSTGWSSQTVVVSNESLQMGNVVVDSHGYPRFTCALNGSLFYESWNGLAWASQEIGQVSYGQRFVKFDSKGFIRLDSRDTPKIACISSYLNEEIGNYVPTIFYMSWNGIGWEIQLVEQFGYFADTTPLALDSKGNPHICYLTGRGTGDQYRFFADGTLMYATSNQPTPTPSPASSPSVPEFPAWTIMALVATTGIGVLVYFKKHREL